MWFIVCEYRDIGGGAKELGETGIGSIFARRIRCVGFDLLFGSDVCKFCPIAIYQF